MSETVLVAFDSRRPNWLAECCTRSIFAVILFLASLWLVIVFPGFIAESARQGANSEVISRLQYFKVSVSRLPTSIAR